jgi:putative DNA primase/helicase
MTSTLQLVDSRLERMLVVAVIRNPDTLSSIDSLSAIDFGDPNARWVFSAIRNLVEAGTTVSADSIRIALVDEILERDPDHTVIDHPQVGDLAWFERMISEPAHDGDPPLPQWANQITQLADVRRIAIESAEPPRPSRRAPTGPRAANDEPVRLAESFMAFRYQLHGEPTLVRWARAWWRYDGHRYVEHDDEVLDREIIGFLDVVVAPVISRKDGTVSLRRVTSRNKTVRELAKSLHHVMPALSGAAPQWCSAEDGDPRDGDAIAVRNGVLDVDRLTLSPPTPRFFSTTCIGCEYAADAPPPARWLAFLGELWGEDNESILALQQMFGYLLTADTSQQKLFALIGPPRSGKGTIARILKALLGDEAVVNPTLQSLEQPFGLAPLVGKTVAIIGDARLGGRSDQAQVAERLLSISGEDALSINRKNRDAINVRLRTRVLLLSNELPRIYDTSGALASRFIILCLTRTFLGNEDLGLEAALLSELPGILQWALEGRADLAEAGRFTVPATSRRAMEELEAISNPMGEFFDEHLELDPDSWTSCAEIYSLYVGWCERSGCKPASRFVMGRDIHTMHPKLATVRRSASFIGTTSGPVSGPSGRVKGYQGVRIRLS